MARKILLAEDDKDDQDFFMMYLKDRGDLSILPIVNNGEEVIEYLNCNSCYNSLPDLIILDQNMPRLNGLNTLAQLKANAAYAHIPVMIYSTYADENLVHKSLAQGAALVCTKPEDERGYNRLIDQFLEAHK